VPPQTDRAMRPKLTSRGAATRNRIVLAAAELMHVQGVAATTIDDVLAASATSKSQFYQHFDDKSELVYEVITMRADEILSWQRLRLEKVDSFRGLYHWRDAMVQRCALRRGLWGCELGSLAAELSDTDDTARASLSAHFSEWRGLLGAALERMRSNGVLVADVDVKVLATGPTCGGRRRLPALPDRARPEADAVGAEHGHRPCGVLRDRRHSAAVTAAAKWT
jgi:TetR/AcrR family transcriptional repressor of nem operon